MEEHHRCQHVCRHFSWFVAYQHVTAYDQHWHFCSLSQLFVQLYSFCEKTGPDESRTFRCPLRGRPPVGNSHMLAAYVLVTRVQLLAIICVARLGPWIYIFYGRHRSTAVQALRGKIAAHCVSPGGAWSTGTKRKDRLRRIRDQSHLTVYWL